MEYDEYVIWSKRYLYVLRDRNFALEISALYKKRYSQNLK